MMQKLIAQSGHAGQDAGRYSSGHRTKFVL